MSPVRVLAIGSFVMGHGPYQLGLERGFAEARHGIAYESIHLPESNRHDLFGRVAYRLLTWRPWRAARTDWDWNRLRGELATSLFLRRLLRRLVPQRQPAVLHLHTQSITLLAADLLDLAPTVISMDCTTALLARLHPAPAARTYRPIIALERRSLAAAAHVVCWSEVVRRSVIDDYGIDPARVSVVRPAVARARLPARAVPPRAAGRPLRLLFVGNDFVRKGGEDLLAVFVDHLAGSCELDVVSNGIEALPPAPGLRLHRGLSSTSPALLQLYADADVFVMPTHEDAFGIVYVEAMAAGLPCIGSRVLAVPELVDDDVTGLTVEAGNRAQLRAAIERLRDDEPLRRRLAAGGLAFASLECDEATNCARLAALFRKLGQPRSSFPVPAQTVGATDH